MGGGGGGGGVISRVTNTSLPDVSVRHMGCDCIVGIDGPSNLMV